MEDTDRIKWGGCVSWIQRGAPGEGGRTARLAKGRKKETQPMAHPVTRDLVMGMHSEKCLMVNITAGAYVN